MSTHLGTLLMTTTFVQQLGWRREWFTKRPNRPVSVVASMLQSIKIELIAKGQFCFLEMLKLPIMFSIGLEIVHIAALGNVHCITFFSLLGSSLINEFTGIFHHKFAFKEFFGRYNPAVLSNNVANFQWQFGVIGSSLTKPLGDICRLVLFETLRTPYKGLDRFVSR